MNSTIERLLGLRVDDVMTRDVVAVTANSTMSEAADLLSHRHVTGAPVIDELGRCIGVLSGTDYIHSKAGELEATRSTHDLVLHPRSGQYQIEEVLDDLVRRQMSPAVQTIDNDCSLTEAARYMCNGHLHRLIVVDDKGAPVGVLTSLDLVSAWIGAVEE